MLTYTVRLPGARTLAGRLSGRVLGDVMLALSHGAAGALRLRVEGRSAARTGPVPGWVERGTDFAVIGFSGEEDPGLVLHAPTLQEALPERFEQGDLFSPVDPRQSALTLMAASLAEATAGRLDSDAFDAELLTVFTRDFARLFGRDRISGFALQNGLPEAPPLELDAAGLRTVRRLRDRTPRPRRVRLAGRIDEAKYSKCAFVLVLGDGARVRGVLTEQGPETLKPHFGEVVAIEGMAQFRPSGRLLRVDVDRMAAAGDRDLAAFSAEPTPLAAAIDVRQLHRPQTARTGLNNVVGRWPGDESDEEVERYLQDIS